MAIQSDDIKLLESAVMADVPEGGGPATGNVITSGESNNIFPDVSTDDRAAGRVNFRKSFGMAHTDNTDMLLGASFVVLKPPADPNVHVTMFESSGWADELDTAKQQVERYLAKGPKLLCRIQDVHYAGSLLLQLYNIAPATGFPAAGDTVVLRNPDESEQYVRINKVDTSTVTAIVGGQQTSVNVASCEIGEPGLEFDLQGKPIQLGEPIAANTAVVYSATPAVGAKFYGVKPLAADASIGDRDVTVEDGIYTPLVPAATVESPVIDIFPLVPRPSLSRTATGALTVSTGSATITAGSVVSLPTAVEPGSLTMSVGATSFTSNTAGELLQGTTVVGEVDHAGRRVVMGPSAPSYGPGALSVTYLPATVVGALAHSGAFEITTNNQGLAFVFDFDPLPAPGSMVLSYMAQGRWYELVDNGAGKLAGADSSYGVGTLNYTTGSAAVTLGAIPDVGSSIIVLWGDENTAKDAVGTRPSRAWLRFTLTDAPKPGSLSFAWDDAAANSYVATVNAAGVVTGPAQVSSPAVDDLGTWTVDFSPDVLPSGPVSLSYTKQADASAFTVSGSTFTLTSAPIEPGTVRMKAIATTAGKPNSVVKIYDDGSGVMRAKGQAIGTINYTTGVINFSTPTVTITRWESVKTKVV